jgi:hypothetical protein
MLWPVAPIASPLNMLPSSKARMAGVVNGASLGVVQNGYKSLLQVLKSAGYSRKKARCVRHAPLFINYLPATHLSRLLTFKIIQNNTTFCLAKSLI